MIRNTIIEDYCSFEVSKLLFNKGFAVKCEYFFNGGSGWKRQSDNILRQYDDLIENPTHALAIKWIRENFKINIAVGVEDGEKEGEFTWSYTILKFADEVRMLGRKWNCLSPENATEEALLYTLQNYIP